MLERLRALGYIQGHQTRSTTRELLPPHGFEYPELVARGEASASLRARAQELPRLELTQQQRLVVAALATGELAPLRGFMNRKDSLRVEREQRLENGLRWPVSLALPVAESLGPRLQVGQLVALHAQQLLATLEVSDVWQHEQTGQWLIGGDVTIDGEALGQDLGPREVRGLAARHGWSQLAMLPTSALGTEQRRAAQSAAEFCDAVVATLSREHVDKPTDLDLPLGAGPLLARVWRPTLAPAARVLLDVIMARNFGAARCLLPLLDSRLAAQAMFRASGADELGVEPWWYTPEAR